MSRSAILLLAAFAVIAVLARVFLVEDSRTERPQDRRQAAETARVMPTGGGATPRAEAARVGEPAASQLVPEETVLTPAQVEKARATAAALRHRARFPPSSRRIEDRVNPIVATRTVQERMSPPGQGRAPTLVVHASSVSYEAPSPIILFAKFIRQWPDDWAVRTDAEIAGELVNAADEVVAELDFLDDGRERDIEAGDGVFTARINPDPDDLDRWNGLIRARVYGETADGDRRSAKTRFYYGAPGARLTGNYQDHLVNGHLELLVELDVKALGEYRIDATLSKADDLIAWAENTVGLEPGIVWMPVTFWGLSLREANQPGPYRLSSIALANVTLKPPQMNDAIGTQYVTAAYRPEDFSAEPYNDPKLLQRADRYEARARGR
jgi:hypothetical protein